MTVHRPHPLTDPEEAKQWGLGQPDAGAAILYDECDRCWEHARQLTSLDESHLRGLGRLLLQREAARGRGAYGPAMTAPERFACDLLWRWVLTVEMATGIPVRRIADGTD